MAVTADVTAQRTQAAEEIGPYSGANLAWHRFRRHRSGMVALVVLAVLVLGVIFVPLFSPYRYDQVSGQPYAVWGTYDTEWGNTHLLGTDPLGRDVLTRVFYAGRASLTVAFIATLISVVIGTIIGGLAGMYGGWVDSALMRSADFLLALPLLPMYLLALRFIRIWFGGGAAEIRDSLTGIFVMVIVLVIFGWMGVSRLVRASILSLRAQTFVEASVALGASNRRVMFRHLLPNCLTPVLVASTFAVGDVIIIEAMLAYFGHGLLDPPTPSWGNLLANNQEFTWRITDLNPYLDVRAYYVLLPALLILITVLCLNYIGEALRDTFSPRRSS
jgi:peptide/nickel transport system permease protein